MDGAGGDLLVGGAVEAELADAEAVVIRGACRKGWAEGAAGERAGGVKIAEAGGGVEDGAGLVVGEVVEGRGARGIEEAGAWVAGEVRGEAGDGCAGARAEGGGAGRVGRIQVGESGAEAGRVELGDGKDADAALGASGSAFEVGAGAAGGVSDGGIDDLDELRVAGGEHENRVAERHGDEEFVMWQRYSAGETEFVRRRDFLKRGVGAAAGALMLGGRSPAAETAADYTIRIAPMQLEIAPGKTVKTTAFNGKVPGDLIRVREGQTVTLDVVNETDVEDIVHWHGLHIPSVQDGATEEGSPASAPHGGRQRYAWRAEPAGFRWYHSHIYAGHHLERATYSGEFGFLMIDAKSDPARYDQEVFLALHDWEGHAEGSSEGYQEVVYSHATINERMLGFGEPLRVKEGQRVLLHVLNASATLLHDLALPGHRFLVTALDGNPVPTPREVGTIRLGPAERVDAVVTMKQPGVWVLGETNAGTRKQGMGMVVEYANRTGEPVWQEPGKFDFQYENFGAASGEESAAEEVRIPLVIKPKFEGYGDFDHWTINGESWPKGKTVMLKEGTRYRLIFDNQSTDIHPLHLHRHSFELKALNGRATAGVVKDVVLLEAGAKTEVAFTANHPGRTLCHCHQQDHMDSGFMMLFDYA